MIIKRFIECPRCRGWTEVPRRGTQAFTDCPRCRGTGGTIECIERPQPDTPREFWAGDCRFVWLEEFSGWWCERTRFLYDPAYVRFWYGYGMAL